MKRYSILHPLVLSFFSQSLYQDVGRNWKGVGFVYLLLLLALSWVPDIVKMQLGLTNFLRSDAAGLVRQLPRITISKGEVSTEVDTPYFINDPKTGKPAAIIDLTGKITSLEGSEALVLLTKKQLIMKKSTAETRVYDLSAVKQFSFDRAWIEGWLQIAGNWFVPALFPFAVLFSYVYRILQALIYGLIGLLFTKFVKASLDYSATVRLAVMAITPVVLLTALLDFLETQIPFWSLICFFIAMGYLFYAVKANASPKGPLSDPGQQSPVT